MNCIARAFCPVELLMLNRYVMEVSAFEVIAGVQSALHIREVIALRATSQDYCFISVVCLIGSCSS